MQKISWKDGIEQLEGMFPTLNSTIIEKTLRDNGGHMETTIDMLLQLCEEIEIQQQMNQFNQSNHFQNDKEREKQMQEQDEQLAKQLQEHEYGMYKALGGSKTMNQFMKDLEDPKKNQLQSQQHQQVKSFWETLSDGAKSLFKQLFGSSNSYTPLDTDDTSRGSKQKFD